MQKGKASQAAMSFRKSHLPFWDHSDFEALGCAFSFVYDMDQAECISESSGDKDEVVVGTKRKIWSSCPDGDSYDVYVENEARKFIDFYQGVFDFAAGPAKALRLPTCAMPTYSGTGKTAIFKRQKSPGPEIVEESGPLVLPSKNIDSMGPAVESSAVNMPQLGPQSSSPLIIQGSSPEDVSALGSEDIIVVAPYPQINEDMLSNCYVWLDPTTDDEDEPEEVPVKVTALKLIAEAKKFKSFGSLLTLHAIK
ncbi:hypothetical protein M422DRAFT_257446 [Sphaerobolus stellatus SS14]|uniref:Unplaced genomic scaffold SPHSTscaffold_74, whole genome shotgun sequence n=1 Tax=Sphaerobolus stellatus (strain SS14) TaxID=990650 RepID=A0A0C9UY82_SPHS4|nr:hypothetical protein M422DRAFT_257446 [Sphaerobolus stellatus SS14]